jgi:hypothetical protein
MKGRGEFVVSSECNNSIRDRGLRQQLQGRMRKNNPGTRRQLRLKVERASDRIDRKAFGLEFVKRARGVFSGLRKVTHWKVCRDRRPPKREYKDQTLWRGRPPPKRKESLLALPAMLGLRDGNV